MGFGVIGTAAAGFAPGGLAEVGSVARVEQFVDSVGKYLEAKLRRIESPEVEVEFVA